jgi:hypothetical protein
VFAVMFLILGCLHWRDSKNFISPFPRSLTSSDFEFSFNQFLKKFNESAQQQNKYAAYGYWLACSTSFFAVFLEWRDRIRLPIKRRKDVANRG